MMDDLFRLINVAFCVVGGLMLSWAILSRRVNDGVVIKAGLIMMILAFFLAAHFISIGELEKLMRPLALLHLGIMVVAVGWFIRARPKYSGPNRRKTDWVSQRVRTLRETFHA